MVSEAEENLNSVGQLLLVIFITRSVGYSMIFQHASFQAIMRPANLQQSSGTNPNGTQFGDTSIKGHLSVSC